MNADPTTFLYAEVNIETLGSEHNGFDVSDYITFVSIDSAIRSDIKVDTIKCCVLRDTSLM